MKRLVNRRYVSRIKKESVEDPHELLLSLVDLGSLDAEEALLACVKEMSDAECKRVLGSLSLPDCCDEVEDDQVEDNFDSSLDNTEEVEDFSSEEFEEDTPEDQETSEDEQVEESRRRRLEAKVRRLERLLSIKNRRNLK